MFYIYQHRRLTDNSIFYVGKGKGDRFNSKKNRNKYWHFIVKKHGFKSEIIKNNLDEDLSLLAEIELIDKYKKIGIKLCNLTDGGNGVSGYKWTEEQKLAHKLNQKERAKNPKLKEIKSILLKNKWKDPEFRKSRNAKFMGEKNPAKRPEVRAKLGVPGYLQKNAKRVKCIETGLIFNTIKEATDWASNLTGLSKKTSLNKCFKDPINKTSFGFHWELVS